MSALFGMAAAIVVAALVSAAVLGLMLHTGRMGPRDEPNSRSLHTVAVPRSGGIGVLAGIACAVALASPPWSWVAAVILLASVSWWDDWHPLPAMVRFAVHLCVAVLVVVDAPAGSFFASAVAVFILVWAINLYNFMDGANGLAGGMAFFGFLAYAGAAWLVGQNELALWAAAVAGAVLGFLRYNFDPARIFLGDIGSTVLGLLAALLGWSGWQQEAWPLWFPFLVFSPFVLDATTTLLRRLLRGEKVWHPHREHYYQRLVRMGWSHRHLALAEYALMAAVAVSALALLAAPPVWQWAGGAAWGAIYVVLMRWIDMLWRKNHAV